MFTGLVEEIGIVNSIKKDNDFFVLSVSADIILNDIKIGDSVAINGVCTTIVKYDKTSFSVDISVATLNVTTLKNLKKGDVVNLERALTPLSRLGGHFVYGHVDFITQLLSIKKEANSIFLTFKIEKNNKKYFVKKGSVTINGVSLTISDIDKNTFTVCIIPHTYKNTNLNQLKINEYVNIETDVIAKYIENYMNLDNNSTKGSNITLEFLKENGF